jgi:hypothetical protein
VAAGLDSERLIFARVYTCRLTQFAATFVAAQSSGGDSVPDMVTIIQLIQMPLR